MVMVLYITLLIIILYLGTGVLQYTYSSTQYYWVTECIQYAKFKYASPDLHQAVPLVIRSPHIVLYIQ